jgi:diguanylate cyclase (GGDEF)-like protein
MMGPRLWSMPAAMAAVCPKLRRKRTTRSHGRRGRGRAQESRGRRRSGRGSRRRRARPRRGLRQRGEGRVEGLEERRGSDSSSLKTGITQAGHPVGDRALRHTADRLADALGDRARLFRYGGEELVALTPVATRDDAGALAEALRRSVRDAPMALESGPLALTLSLGVAFYDGREAVTAQVVVDRADRALYRAKRAGRDRVAQWARGLDDEA